MMRDILKNRPICAIMRNVPMDRVADYAEAVCNGGILLFEIAMNTENGAKQIQLLRERFETRPDVWIGAGTVTTKERCRAAEEAGAGFFLTPSVSEYTLQFCRERNIPLLPGVMTPTDVAVCLEYGYDVLKLFPAGDLPESYIRSLKGPFDGTDYVAVGGVNADNIKALLSRGFLGVGIGSNLVPAEYVRNRDWDGVECFVRNMVNQVLDSEVAVSCQPL